MTNRPRHQRFLTPAWLRCWLGVRRGMQSAQPFVDAAVALHRSHPHAPTADVLEVALQGVDRRSLVFGQEAEPPSAFGMMVAEVHDNTGFTLEEWGWLANPRIDPKLATALREIWRDKVWPRFLANQHD